MAGIAVDWARNLNPNKKIVVPGEDSMIRVPLVITYGYPLKKAISSAVLKVK